MIFKELEIRPFDGGDSLQVFEKETNTFLLESWTTGVAKLDEKRKQYLNKLVAEHNEGLQK